ncbi:hypothetical protein DIZ81_10355 [Legionella taurinensis]|uniref:Uncharacterized protein n=1 Tax=Legionella taurinensis TaxID=70611 RepID=A0AB38N527_9GAMM|nr:hypothetical protein [Legionella taurinensis]MDX1838269.1 hypothetical protein [Legionella taurinensis]PUT39240.1 hypothetical protein DB744_10365 [Legionella taurinensis]PUT40586.1 hypothetical protein DB746_10885 [Legionella taurinensis]PUT44006.1 hypothetical protein DB743_09085 [Legionella taurinensis]PUT46268.1 hypothetical protein DB745_11370 [Legionella taurinensis]
MKTTKKLRHAKRLDKASGFFFLMGFVFSKLQTIPIVFVSSLFNLLSLMCYLTAYTLWLAACERYPDHPPRTQSWYGLVQFKNQHKVAAVLGTLAILICVAAIAFPPALIASAWLFLVSNVLWCIAEYHKMRHPPVYDKEYSSKRQAVYMRYALLMTSASIVTAVATTLVFCFPPAALATLITATILCLLINLVALQDWVVFTWVKHPPDAWEQSHTHMNNELGCELGHEPALDEEAEDVSVLSQSSEAPSSSEGTPLQPLWRSGAVVEPDMLGDAPFVCLQST